MLRWILALLLLTAPALSAEKFLRWDGRAISRSCDAGDDSVTGLKAALIEKDYAEIGFQQKIRTGYFGIPKNAKSFVKAMKPKALLAHLQTTLAALDKTAPASALMVYDAALHNGTYTLCAWLVTRDGVVASANTPLPNLSLSRLTEAAFGVFRSAATRSAVAVEDPTGAVAASARQVLNIETLDAQAALRVLGDALMPEALGKAILDRDIRRLLVLPTTELGTLPFAALPLGDGQVVDKAAVVVLSDLSPLFAKNVGSPLGEGRSRFVIGTSWLGTWAQGKLAPLPGAETEVKAVAHALNTGPALNTFVMPEDVLGVLKQSVLDVELIYIATHGIADPVNPMDGSYLAFPKGPLFARDIKTLNFQTSPLVVMSACQSGLGKVFDGGTFGLARAWMEAGAAQVVISLWNVSDAGTATLMTRFADELAAGGTGAGRFGGSAPEFALQSAMLAVRRETANPMIWAAFTVYGLPSGLVTR